MPAIQSVFGVENPVDENSIHESLAAETTSDVAPLQEEAAPLGVASPDSLDDSPLALKPEIDPSQPPKGIPGGVDDELRKLIAQASRSGRLSYEQAAAYLPDETYGAERINALLSALEGRRIQLYETNPHRTLDDCDNEGDRSHLLRDGLPSSSNDPIRMYLSQMAEIPLLTRDEEVALAKKIELTRKRFRPAPSPWTTHF